VRSAGNADHFILLAGDAFEAAPDGILTGPEQPRKLLGDDHNLAAVIACIE
jgi:hypothetical protein